MMLDNLDYIQEEGKRQEHDLVMFALSTCGFCKRALNYLQSQSYNFRYVFIDNLPVDTKNAVKKELLEKYQKEVYFPFLIIDQNRVLTGFDEETWDRTLSS